MKFISITLLLGLVAAQQLNVEFSQNLEGFESKVILNDDNSCQLLDYRTTTIIGLSESNPTKLHESKLAHFEGEQLPSELSKPTMLIQGINQTVVDTELSRLCNKVHKSPNSLLRRADNPTPHTEVRKLLSTGDSKNRIDIVFMGDGYQLAEKAKFFEDIDFLIKKLFEGVTFESFLPVYNVWGVFVESKDSGITKANVKKDTAFQLYRPGEELRAIYYDGRIVPDLARKYCSLTGPYGCDYKVIIANDEFYGGLGGDLIISTSSKRSGSVVLNHEMGHTFANVGDEYDNSYAYFGANSQNALTDLNNVKWRHWIDGPVKEEKNINRLLLYPWFDLGNGIYTANFTSTGDYSTWFLRSGLSGMEKDGVIKIELDNQVIPWKSPNTIDRVFFEHFSNTPLTKGNHTLKFTQLVKPATNNPKRMVTSVTFHEYDKDFPFNGEKYSLFPTWDDHGIKRYRPTNEFCVMRNVTQPNFCKVCKESLWLQYFQRISLIDDFKHTILVNNQHVKIFKFDVTTLKLGQFRQNLKANEKIELRWYLHDKLVEKWNDKTKVILKREKSCPFATWTLKVTLRSPEVRKDANNLLDAYVFFGF